MEPEASESAVPVAGRIAWYAVAIFLSSAGLMVLEIAAGRLLAPYIGVSLYSWTAIIGVVLGGLSLGNWLGGVWADRGGSERSAGLVLGLGAVSCVGILLLLTLVAPPLQRSELGLLTVSFLFVAALFFLPAMLLGVVTPLLTTLALRLDARTGHIVGMMHALAALGSIVGTFATGYLFVQYFGTHSVILGTGVVLGLLALAFLLRARWTLLGLAVLAVAVTVWTEARGGFLRPCDRESNYFCIRVIDMSAEVPFGRARGMVLDHLLHGISHEGDPELLVAPYTHLMDELIAAHLGDRQHPPAFFFAGGGSYTQPRAIQSRYPGSRVVVAELDPAVTSVAQSELYFEPGDVRIIHSDARRVLQRLQEQHFDIIVGDVFHDIAVPFHLVTREYAGLVKSRLHPGGLYILNVVDVYPNPKLVKSMLKTLRGVFAGVHVWIESREQPDSRVTYVISAGDAHSPPARIRATRGLQREWHDVTPSLVKEGTPLSALPLLTDDRVPVERLLSTLIFTELGR
ncbi:MAG: fused MFS/spermidine synthase [Gammaproteobacteria bacterium]|nr:MAG: fused MFS/spermidine synthase [Gammaproteobacteria bacterium]